MPDDYELIGPDCGRFYAISEDQDPEHPGVMVDMWLTKSPPDGMSLALDSVVRDRMGLPKRATDEGEPTEADSWMHIPAPIVRDFGRMLIELADKHEDEWKRQLAELRGIDHD